MEIKEVNVNDLIPYEFNNKIHNKEQVNRIANSIKEFWFLQPLVIDKNNILIVWHGRLEWAKKLWLKTVPCVYADNLTEQQIKKYRILDNKLNESEWDIENLKLELDELPDLNIWELELEVKDLFPELVDQEEEKAVEEDEAPEVQKEAKMVRGGGFIHLMKSSLAMLRFYKDWRCWNAYGWNSSRHGVFRSTVQYRNDWKKLDWVNLVDSVLQWLLYRWRMGKIYVRFLWAIL